VLVRRGQLLPLHTLVTDSQAPGPGVQGNAFGTESASYAGFMTAGGDGKRHLATQGKGAPHVSGVMWGFL